MPRNVRKSIPKFTKNVKLLHCIFAVFFYSSPMDEDNLQIRVSEPLKHKVWAEVDGAQERTDWLSTTTTLRFFRRRRELSTPTLFLECRALGA